MWMYHFLWLSWNHLLVKMVEFKLNYSVSLYFYFTRNVCVKEPILPSLVYVTKFPWKYNALFYFHALSVYAFTQLPFVSFQYISQKWIHSWSGILFFSYLQRYLVVPFSHLVGYPISRVFTKNSIRTSAHDFGSLIYEFRDYFGMT